MENEVQQVISSVKPLPQNQTLTPTPPSTNWIKIFLFTFLGLIVIAVSVLAGIQIGKGQTSSQQSAVTQPTVSPTQTTVNPTDLPVTPSYTTDPTADWKTYSNNLYPYSVKYPIDWQTSETKHGTASTIDASQSKLMTDISNSKSSIKIFYEGDFDHGFEPWVFKNSEKVIIGGKEATKSILTLEGNPNEWINYMIKDFHDFRIEVNVAPSDKNIVDLILSTFKFTN